MVNFITGLVGVITLIVFLGYYAISLNSAPLWIIIVAILAMVCRDFFQSVSKGTQKSEK